MTKIFFLGVFLLNTTALAETKNQILWQEWYLLTKDGVAQGYFEETMERRPGDKHLALSQRWVEKGKSETYIGSVVQDNKDLTPVAFFSEKKSATNAYKIDGRAKNGKLEITFKPLKPAGKQERKSLALKQKILLSNFLPKALSFHIGDPGSFSFIAVVEDAQDGIFDSRTGVADVSETSKNFKGTPCYRSIVTFNGLPGEWWITKDGKLCELQLPTTESKVQWTTEAEAKKALGM